MRWELVALIVSPLKKEFARGLRLRGMRKAEAEDRKAAAFEMVASKLGSTEVQQDDSLTKLERLLKLKENGAITEEEYNKKKEEILKYI